MLEAQPPHVIPFSSKPTRKLKVGVVDFFCGCGGVSHGLQMIQGDVEFQIIEGIDNDPHCAATYQKMIGAPCQQIDILALSLDDRAIEERMKIWKRERFDRLLLVGCSPCQGFSAHRKSVGGHDTRRDLFEAFCRIAAKVQPDAILMENVPDLFSKAYWHHFDTGRRTLKAAGYHVQSAIYNFAGFGLPQERFRAVVMAFQESFSLPHAPIQSDRYCTVRQAISHLAPLASGQSHPVDPMHVASTHREATLETIRQVPKNGGNRPMGVGPACLDRTRQTHGGFTDVYGRLAWDKPSVTITARCRTPSCGRFTHPDQDRGLTVREAALLQGFPDSYIFEGPFDDRYKQVGNAVSPMAAAGLGRFIASHLGKKDLSEFNTGAPPIPVVGPVGPGFAVTINGIKRKRVKIKDAA
ncbi:DNA cytosine methyltransferase [Rhizobium leguminosarum]|uniref:DNA cytosine methyltransferase n=1 Tax=Rhizobium leguminosarum TaxID=384 RepID=UPI001C93ECD4|nr:DNA cytosine methyltransferase [Rhizobium leguminosarum]MBY5473594.1 DNA cytosine methyltransferase [Rhizobium leguminosarum]